MGFCGNSYCQIEKDSKGKAIALHQFPLDYFDEIKLVKNKLYYYNRNDDKLYRGDEILHFKTLSKTDDYFGLSPLQSLQTSLNLNVKSQKTVDNFYSKNANTTKILEYTGAAGSNKKIDEVLDKFEQENSGVGEAGGTIIIPPNFKLSELKLSVEDAKFLETAAFSEKSIAALYGIPVSMLGHSDNKYSTYEQENIAFINNTISGLLSIITTELEFKLLTDTQIANNYQIEFDAEKLAGTTAADKATYYKTLKDMGVLSPNQVAAKLGYQTTDNEYMDYHYTQMQYVPLEKWLDSVNSLKSVGFSKPAVDSSEEKNKEIL